MNDGDKGEAGAECPSGKAYAYPGGNVPEMLPAVVFFTDAFRISGYQSYRTQDKKLVGQAVFSGGFPEAVLAKVLPEAQFAGSGSGGC